jgi:hypothetical protein
MEPHQGFGSTDNLQNCPTVSLTIAFCSLCGERLLFVMVATASLLEPI